MKHFSSYENFSNEKSFLDKNLVFQYMIYYSFVFFAQTPSDLGRPFWIDPQRFFLRLIFSTNLSF